MDIDNLQIRIEGEAKSASATIDSLVQKLGGLSAALANVDSAPLKTLSSRVRSLTNSVNSLGKADTAGVKSVANSLSNMSKLNLSGFGSNVSRVSGSMRSASKSGTSLAAAFGKFYANYFMVVRGVKGLWNSIEKTGDYMEALNYYTVSFGKIASDWNKDWEKYGYESAEEYGASFSDRMNDTFAKLSGVQFDEETGLLSSTGMKNLGLNIQEVTQYASQLASVTNSVGQTGETSLATASAFTKLAGDLSSLFNMDYSDVANNLQSGLIGQSRALYKYGIDITNATLQTYAYEQGIEKAVSEMTQGEKMQLRILAILDQSAVAWGDQANTINSFSNGVRQLMNNLSEAGMVLGQLFIPMMTKVLPVINGAIIAIKNLMTNIAGFLGIEIDKELFGEGYSDMAEDSEELAGGLDDVADSAKKAKKGLRGFDELNTLTSGTADTGAAGAIPTFDLTEQIMEATAEYEAAWLKAYEAMQNKAQEFADKIGEALEPVKKLFEDISLGDWFAVGEDVSKLASGIFDFFTKAIEEVDWQEVGTKIGEFFKGIDWTRVLTAAGETIGAALQAALDLASGWIDAAPVEAAIIGAIALLKFTGLGGKLGTAISTALKAGGIKIALPVASIGIAMAAEWKIGEEKTELEKNIEELGEQEGRMASGSGFFDRQALYRHDLETATNDVGAARSQQMNNFKEKLTGFFESWKSKSEAYQTDLENLNTEISNSYSEMFDNISEKVSTWFEEDVKPWFTKEKWQKLGENAKKGIESKWKEFTDWWSTTGVSKWFNEKVKPWFTKEKWQNLGTNIRSGIESKWKAFTNWWQISGVSKWFNEKVKPWFTKEKWQNIMSGIKDGFKTSFNNAANAAIEIFNKLIRWINEKMNFSWDAMTIMGKTIIPAGEVQLFTIPEIPKFAIGGFPEDGLFMANHTELVGRFSNGRTAVANNEQITQGIADAVYPAVYNAVSAAFANKSADPIRVYVGDRELTEIVVAGINQKTRAGQHPLYGW